MRPPMNESPPPTRSTICVISYVGAVSSRSPVHMTPDHVLCEALMEPRRVITIFLARGKRSIIWRPTDSYDAASTSPEVTSAPSGWRSEEHTSELQSRGHLVCRVLL